MKWRFPRLSGSLPAVVVLGLSGAACGSSTSPISTPTTPQTPPTVIQSGKIDDLQAARDIIDWNITAPGGSSYRQPDMICRWDLPVRVFIQDSADRDRVIAAFDYWQKTAAMTYVLVSDNTLPRTLVRFGTDGLAPWGGARSLVDRTAGDNTATSGLIVYEPGGGTYCANGASSRSCLVLYRHELGHVFGIFLNTTLGLMGSDVELSPRELRMLAALYSLPHGAHVELDGTWKVYGQ